MYKLIAFAAFLAVALAAPGGVLVSHAAIPVVHTVPIVAAKTTITKSSQVVNHGSPVVHAVHAAPVLHTAHVVPVVHAAPVALKTSHSSSVVHHGVPLVKTVPLVAVHH